MSTSWRAYTTWLEKSMLCACDALVDAEHSLLCVVLPRTAVDMLGAGSMYRGVLSG